MVKMLRCCFHNFLNSKWNRGIGILPVRQRNCASRTGMAPITCFVSHTLRVSMRRKLRTGPLREPKQNRLPLSPKIRSEFYFDGKLYRPNFRGEGEPIIQGELVFLLVVSGLLLKTCLGHAGLCLVCCLLMRCLTGRMPIPRTTTAGSALANE